MYYVYDENKSIVAVCTHQRDADGLAHSAITDKKTYFITTKPIDKVSDKS